MDYDKLLNLGTELGRGLMLCGAEIYRVEESVTRLLTAYDVEPEVFALPTCLIVSIAVPDGPPITRMCRIPTHGTNIELLEQYNDLCRSLCRNPLPVDEVRAHLDRLAAVTPYHPVPVILLGYAATAAFFTLFFGGGPWDWLAAALCGLAVGLCVLHGRRIIGPNAFLRTALASCVAAGLALTLTALGLGRDSDCIIIGTLMLLVPGMSLTNAMREIMAGDIFSGMSRSAEAILTAAAIALGTALPMMVSGLY